MAGYGPMARSYERQQQRTAPLDEIDKLEQVRKSLPPSSIPGWAEPLVTMGTGLAGSAAGGLAALGTIPANMLGLSGSSPADVLSSIQQRMTYLPRTVEGMGALYGLGKAAEAMHAPVARAAGAVLEATGSPAAATAVDVGPAALGAIAGLPFGPGRTAVNAARAAIPDVAPSAPGLGPGITGQRGIIVPAQLGVDQATLRRALAMQAAGRGSFGIFGDTNVWLNSSGTETPHGRPLAEIPDTASNASLVSIAPPPDPKKVAALQELLSTINARYAYAEARQAGKSHEEAMDLVKDIPGAYTINPRIPISTGSVVMQMKRLQSELAELEKPRFGGTLGSVISHPELFDRFPRMRKVLFTTDKNADYAGKYNPDLDTITLSERAIDLGDKYASETLIHEAGHAMQHHYGLPGGASPRSARTRLLESRKRGLVPDDDLYARLIGMNSDDVYRRAWGEGLSNSAMNAIGWSDSQRRAIPPWARMTDAKGNAIPPNQFWIPPR